MTTVTSSASPRNYANDAIGRRTAVEKTGTVFAQADTISYGYNDRSEVTSGVAVNDANCDYGYSYDPIGNRLQSSIGQQTCSYTSNLLNQYAAVSCLPSAPTYDDDGNVTSMPSTTNTWTLAWDAENRLVSAESATQRLELAYDYMSRRVQKKTYSGTPGNWTPDETIVFLYDGWNLVSELTSDNQEQTTTTKIYTWGLDLSQSLQGVGGIGGLLCVNKEETEGRQSYYASYDANGNVSEYLDASAVIAAHYEYDPFGSLTATTGSKVADFAHRFSTKRFDAPTGLCYYGYRYYNAEMGRWVNRDPIGERGGASLAAFCRNMPVSAVDSLGQAYWWIIPVVVVVGGAACAADCADFLRDTRDAAVADAEAEIQALHTQTTYDSSYHGPTLYGTPADALKHCIGTCRAVQAARLSCFGLAFSLIQGLDSGSSEDGLQDRQNNSVGRAITGDCVAGCLQRLATGGLTCLTVTGDPMPSGATRTPCSPPPY